MVIFAIILPRREARGSESRPFRPVAGRETHNRGRSARRAPRQPFFLSL